MRYLLVPLLWVLLVGVEAVSAGPSTTVPALVDGALADGSGAAGSLRGALRRRPITARTDVLEHADGSPRLLVGQRVGLALFDDTAFTATITDVTRHSVYGRTWSARLDGVDLGHAVLALYEGALVGAVVLPGAVYRIGYGPDGRQIVEQVDPSTLPAELDPVSPPLLVTGSPGPEVAADSGAQIDVMVLYTAAARAAAGGPGAMTAEVALAVASANQAYANNGLAQRLRLVFAGESALTESGSFNADLNNLRFDPTAAWLRDATRADLVSLITSHGASPSFCGIGFLMLENSTGFAPSGFSVADRICASSNLTFAHELGHNMGAHHDPFVAGSEATLFPYSHGYVDLTGKFRTIMAYDDQCQASGFSCTRIAFFSTPGLTSGGRPIGTAATSDNARTLGQTADTVANFRQAQTSALTLSAGTNQPSFAVGQTLVTALALADPGIADAVDVYVGLMLPGGTIVFFTGGGGYAVGTVGSLASFRPLATGVSLTTPFSVSVPSFFSYRWTGIEPRGGFVFFVLVVRTGGLGAGLASDQVLRVAVAPFSFP